ncbi:unnamed protein product [Amoebophrya sp. A25]|nr:unnamed protein product [Amoebophrya sp. A25]CAD7976967.1 unnamed protein product [Amoebophrya sp. A25]|eukprot:GSA25T00027782001.1
MTICDVRCRCKNSTTRTCNLLLWKKNYIHLFELLLQDTAHFFIGYNIEVELAYIIFLLTWQSEVSSCLFIIS